MCNLFVLTFGTARLHPMKASFNCGWVAMFRRRLGGSKMRQLPASTCTGRLSSTKAPPWIAASPASRGIGRRLQLKAHGLGRTPNVKLRWQLWLGEAIVAMYADAVGIGPICCGFSRNARREHPPCSIAPLQICNRERPIRNPKPFALTPVWGDVVGRTRRTMNHALEDQILCQQCREFWPVGNITTPRKAHTHGNTRKHRPGAAQHAWGGIHSQRHAITWKASSTHA
jgi:hypothetical protein